MNHKWADDSIHSNNALTQCVFQKRRYTNSLSLLGRLECVSKRVSRNIWKTVGVCSSRWSVTSHLREARQKSRRGHSTSGSMNENRCQSFPRQIDANKTRLTIKAAISRVSSCLLSFIRGWLLFWRRRANEPPRRLLILSISSVW